MTLSVRQTIFALASAPGKAGVSIFRISGPQALHSIDSLTKLTQPKRNNSPLTPSHLHLCTVYSALDGQPIDRGMIAFFQSPRSFTGEDVVEFHVHGSIAVCNSLLSSLASLPGYRLAERGEFAKRAFLNGKLDLVEAEGLGALIDACSEQQRKEAFKHLSGQVTRLIQEWSNKLFEAMAAFEAFIDFGEEEAEALGGESQLTLQVCKVVSEVERSISLTLQASSSRRIIQDGFKVVVVGDANVGKSSFVNAVAQRKVSIVAPVPGTTRDIVRTWVDLGGWRVEIADTAGIREQLEGENCPIEREGIALSLEETERADFVIQMIDATNPKFALEKADLTVFNKCDQLQAKEIEELRVKYPSALFISCISPLVGIEEVCEGIVSRISKGLDNVQGEGAFVANARQQEILQEARNCCLKFMQAERWKGNVAVGAEYLRMANEALGRVTGRVDVERVLGEIFGKFCIGK